MSTHLTNARTIQAAPASRSARLIRLAMGHITAQAIHVFAVVGVADAIGDEARHAEDIARITGTDVTMLDKVLRLMASDVGVLAQDAAGRYTLTDLGRCLRSTSRPPMRDLIVSACSDHHWRSMGELLYSVRSGKNAFEHVYGRQFFDYLHEHPDQAREFEQSMNGSSEAGAGALLAAYDFSGFQRIVDVGGGWGALLMAILARHPAACGVLQDQASVLDRVAVPAALSNRLVKVPGDFFDGVPPGGDAYLLRRILHDWNDARAVRILQQCRRAMSSASRLLIVELSEPRPEDSRHDFLISDLLLTLMCDGRERTAAEFERLLAAADFTLSNVVRTASPYWIIEARPA